MHVAEWKICEQLRIEKVKLVFGHEQLYWTLSEIVTLLGTSVLKKKKKMDHRN